ncbi:hypothetical protein KBC04_04190 [Candidatus Babeliales bacterium]|nr:hypothetical protein [Candidatus Babeliales bacterium]MBP9844266.1 hypothetical protein [Candidatus Babeliales bacterium]
MKKKLLILSLLTLVASIFLIGSDTHRPRIGIRKFKNNTPYILHLIDRFHQNSQCFIKPKSQTYLDYNVEGTHDVDDNETEDEIQRKAQFSIKALNPKNNQIIDECYLNIAIQSQDAATDPTAMQSPMRLRFYDNASDTCVDLKHNGSKDIYIYIQFTTNEESQATSKLIGIYGFKEKNK